MTNLTDKALRDDAKGRPPNWLNVTARDAAATRSSQRPVTLRLVELQAERKLPALDLCEGA